jgi:hypothetical protein
VGRFDSILTRSTLALLSSFGTIAARIEPIGAAR